MKSAIVKSLILASLLGPFLLLANEEDPHIPVGTRPKGEVSAPLASQPQQEPREEENCGFYSVDKYPPVYFPSVIHWLVAVSALGDSVELEDGSVWKIGGYDSYKALNWRSNDPLMITQNTRWFSKYDYRIINKNTGSAIEASLYLGPIKNGEFTHYITVIDFSRYELILSDNTHWAISFFDRSSLRDWVMGDAVIIGSNSGWDSSCENILINVNMNNYLRAKQF